MSEYTKGEWKVIESRRQFIIRDESGFIAVTPKFESAETAVKDKANANLIAAAPDMLEALKELYSDWSILTSSYGGAAIERIDDMVKAAIAKAEGK